MAPKTVFEVRREAKDLGYRQYQVDKFARQYHAEHGVSPSYSMICAALGIATKGEVSDIVASLERLGLMVRNGSGRTRRIHLLPRIA